MTQQPEPCRRREERADVPTHQGDPFYGFGVGGTALFRVDPSGIANVRVHAGS